MRDERGMAWHYFVTIILFPFTGLEGGKSALDRCGNDQTDFAQQDLKSRACKLSDKSSQVIQRGHLRTF
jgi:hypothetical protein